jgi:cytochrome c peroxidase
VSSQRSTPHPRRPRDPRRRPQPTAILVLLILALAGLPGFAASDDDPAWLDTALEDLLEQHEFTGEIESTLEERMGRPIDTELAELGNLLFFDEILSLNNDNACAGCHSPAVAFGDPQSMAYGVENNRIVGPQRDGTRNLRRAPVLTNTAFIPRLMLDGRFEVPPGGDPFDNSDGFVFPPPNDVRFGTSDPLVPNLLTAQAFMPVQDLTEMAGFQGTAGTIGPRFDQFDDGEGTPIPPPPDRPDKIWDLVLERLNGNAEYRQRFAQVFGPGEIVFGWVGQAIAEFQISLLAANAPIDRFARGDHGAMTAAQKRGALLFFGEAGCADCHAVAGGANEMFSDFEMYVVGVPQISPPFGAGTGNRLFDGSGEDEDFGRFNISGDDADLYAFRTSPLRNIAVQPTFFHDGAYLTLEEAVRHHLDAAGSLFAYDPEEVGVEDDLHHLGPVDELASRIDPLLASPLNLTDQEVTDLVAFVGEGLLDPRALPENLCDLVPESVPSGRPLPWFERCQQESVTLCHTPPGEPEERVTIAVPHDSVQDHIDHGDPIGLCPS